MRVRPTLLVRFTLLSAFVTMLIAAGFSWLLSRQMIEDALVGAEQEVANGVTTVISPEVTAEDFAAPTPSRVAAWKRRVGQVLGGMDIVRVKVWNATGQVVYSDDPDVIGRTYRLEDEEELREALEGHLMREISTLAKSENVGERGYGRLMEIYVPVVLPGSSEVVGAYEVYRRYDPLAAKIGTIRRLLWGGATAAFGLLYASLFVLVSGASRQLSRQQGMVARLASFPEMNPNPVIETDLAGHITYLNSAGGRIFPELRKAGLQHPALRELLRIAHELQTAGRDSLVDEIRIGPTIYERVVTRIPETNHLRIYTLDVTAGKRAEAHIRGFFTLSLDMLCITGFDGYFKQLNPAWEKTLGFTIEELKAKPFIEFVHPEDREATIAEAQRLTTGAEAVSFENRYQTKDGSYRWLLWSATVSLEEQLYYAVARDITERKRAGDAIRQARDEAERANRAKSEFLSRMSHELRTPLNAVIGFSELLLERIPGDVTAKQEEFLRDIRDSGTHLLALINDILDISKIEAGKLTLTFAETDLAEVVESAVTTLRPLIEQKRLSVSSTLNPRVPVIRADRMRLKQILYNLLSNAVKFTPEGGQIRVEAERINGDVELAVVDTGPGIAPEEQGRLFQEFTQLPAAQQAGQGGTGLGLSLVRRLVELHGGRVWVESQVGTGSRFIVRLPIGAGPGAERPAEGPGPVLVVEDDAATRRLFVHYLTEAGYRTEEIGDGPGVVDRVKAVRPAAICLDIRLPGVEDWEILRRLKEDPVTAPIPIVVATVLDDAQRAFALGATRFLVKPIGRQDLLDAVARALSAHSEGTPTVLVVDDDPHVRAMIPPMLEQAGYHTLVASGGQEGILQAQQHLPHLIVLDLLMPEVSGFDVIAVLRGDLRTREIPIVVLTAKDLTPEERAFLEQRVQTVRVKGATPPRALVEEVARVLAAPGTGGS